MTRKGKAWRAVAGAVLLLAALVAAAPHFPAGRFRPRIDEITRIKIVIAQIIPRH